MYRRRDGDGARFADLLARLSEYVRVVAAAARRRRHRRRGSDARVAACGVMQGVASRERDALRHRVAPEVRFRFTSPHPKDFPPALIDVIKERPNICKQVHLPVQSGSSAVLARMRRGYSREAYLALVESLRAVRRAVAGCCLMLPTGCLLLLASPPPPAVFIT